MNIIRFVGKLQGVVKNNYSNLGISERMLQLKREEDLRSIWQELNAKINGSPILHGYSVYSQNDEDGILENIFDRIAVSRPIFFEFGVAEQENNTNYLLLKGSKGCWIDKGLSEFKGRLPVNKKLKVYDDFVKMENIVSIIKDGCQFLGIEGSEIDLISLDLDGNDYYFIENVIREGIFPKVFSLEYNAMFRPPVDIKINYSANHIWANDDYFGCSLMSYYNLLSPLYTLVSCNIPGSNCFFVLNEYKARFKDYTVTELYQPPRYFHSPFNKGHRPTSRFILDRISQG
jgi:hypothetical protein